MVGRKQTSVYRCSLQCVVKRIGTNIPDHIRIDVLDNKVSHIANGARSLYVFFHGWQVIPWWATPCWVQKKWLELANKIEIPFEICQYFCSNSINRLDLPSRSPPPRQLARSRFPVTWCWRHSRRATRDRKIGYLILTFTGEHNNIGHRIIFIYRTRRRFSDGHDLVLCRQFLALHIKNRTKKPFEHPRDEL